MPLAYYKHLYVTFDLDISCMVAVAIIEAYVYVGGKSCMKMTSLTGTEQGQCAVVLESRLDETEFVSSTGTGSNVE